MDASKLMFRDGLMAGERILVTGGGTGLGSEMAEAFLKLGASVYICGRRQNKLDETAAELTVLHGGKIVFTGTPQALLQETGIPTLEQAFLAKIGSGVRNAA